MATLLSRGGWVRQGHVASLHSPQLTPHDYTRRCRSSCRASLCLSAIFHATAAARMAAAMSLLCKGGSGGVKGGAAEFYFISVERFEEATRGLSRLQPRGEGEWCVY